jgi:MFS superfamily sulfate permease-like transporter
MWQLLPRSPETRRLVRGIGPFLLRATRSTDHTGLVVYRYDAPLFFANAQDFRRRALTAAQQRVAAQDQHPGEEPGGTPGAA